MSNSVSAENFDFDQLFALLADYYISCDAPVKKFEAVSAATPFQILISAMLSARTNDKTTTEVIQNWAIEDYNELQGLSAQAIQKLIYPVGFYQQKAKHLSQWHDIIKNRFAGNLPRESQEVMSLPGVGLKTVNLYLARAYGQPLVCVDIHVHRICARLGLTSGNTPQQTEEELSHILPKQFIGDANRYFVALGQTICKAQKPECSRCPLLKICVKKGV